MMPGEFASICILSFNRVDFVRESLASLARPGYPIEIIVGDDGSEPDVQDWLLLAHHQGLISKLVLNPPGRNEGVGAMVCDLFALAAGDYLIKADQDLLFKPGAIGEFVRVFTENADRSARGIEPELGTLGGFRYETDPVDHLKMFKAQYPAFDEVEDYVSSCMVLPRRIWEERGPWETHSAAFAEDIEFKHRLSAAGYVHGLTRVDQIVNRGFGPGPSTVVLDERDEAGNYKVQTIHYEPKVFGA